MSSAKLITRDSVNMIFESLSCKGNTYLVDMDVKNKVNKVVNTVNGLIEEKKLDTLNNLIWWMDYLP